MQGQLEHFRSRLIQEIFPNLFRDADWSFAGYAAEKIEYGINRYDNETHRLYNTMETHLAKSPHGLLVGDRVTIADIACLGWIANHGKIFLSTLHKFFCEANYKMQLPLDLDGVPLDKYPYLGKWLKKLLARPSYEKAQSMLS